MSFSPQQRGNPNSFQINPAQGIRTAQIICAAMILGATMFFVITLVMPVQQQQQQQPIMAFMAAGFAAVAMVLRFIVPGRAVSAQIKNLSAIPVENLDGHLFAIFQTRMIIGLALLEGACFFNLTAYVADRQIWTLAVVGFLMLLMAMMFPTLSRFESWSEDRKRDLQNQF